MARGSKKVPCKGRLQKRKTIISRSITFGLPTHGRFHTRSGQNRGQGSFGRRLSQWLGLHLAQSGHGDLSISPRRLEWLYFPGRPLSSGNLSPSTGDKNQQRNQAPVSKQLSGYRLRAAENIIPRRSGHGFVGANETTEEQDPRRGSLSQRNKDYHRDPRALRPKDITNASHLPLVTFNFDAWATVPRRKI